MPAVNSKIVRLVNFVRLNNSTHREQGTAVLFGCKLVCFSLGGRDVP